jgi:PhnB protein
MTQLNAYLRFYGNCREAMTFYQACLGGELWLQTFGESPMAGEMPPAMKDNVLHSSLTKDSLVLMAADMMEPGEVIKGNTFSLCVVGSSKAEIEPAFAKLSEGGNVGHPLNEEFFGTFGELTDKFGIDWMFQADSKANA